MATAVMRARRSPNRSTAEKYTWLAARSMEMKSPLRRQKVMKPTNPAGKGRVSAQAGVMRNVTATKPIPAQIRKNCQSHSRRRAGITP